LAVFIVHAPKVEEAAPAGAPGEAKQPEVIKEKKPADGAAPAADAKGAKPAAKK
jgi:hypothetical protein